MICASKKIFSKVIITCGQTISNRILKFIDSLFVSSHLRISAVNNQPKLCHQPQSHKDTKFHKEFIRYLQEQSLLNHTNSYTKCFLISQKVLLFTIAVTNFAFSQSTDSLDLIVRVDLPSFLSTRFYKQLSTYNLNTRFDLTKTWNDFDIRVQENFNSTFVRSTEKSIRDEQSLAVQNKYQLIDGLSLGLGFNSNIFSDNRRIEINQASTNQLFLFSRIEPEQNIHIAPFAGYINNRQVLKDDDGLVYGTEALLNKLVLPDLIISSDLKFRNEDISPRKNTIRHYGLLLNSEFTDEVSNFVNAVYSQNRKDFYFEADSITSQEFNVANNIQSRIETNYSIQDRLKYDNLFNLFSMDVLGAVNWRYIERDTRYKSLQNVSTSIFDSEINELKLDFETLLAYDSKSFNGLLRVIYSERDEKNLAKRIPSVSEDIFQNRMQLEGRKNNNSIRASLSFLGNLVLSQSDMISFSLFHNKLRYDTPSSENFDDRDELLSIARLRYTRRFTPFFEGFINTEGTYNQTVYIFSQKSSNNNINRILKLTAGGTYKGSKLSSMNSFEVSANYTVYDFQDLNPNIKSYSFRQFTALDSTNYAFTKKFKFSLFGYLKLSEQGDLKWNEFSSRPTRYLQEIFCEPKLSAAYSLILYSVGVRFFSLATYGYKLNNKFLDSEFRSIGPIAEILISGSENLFLKVYGWYEFITLSNNSKKEQTNLNVEMTWSF